MPPLPATVLAWLLSFFVALAALVLGLFAPGPAGPKIAIGVIGFGLVAAIIGYVLGASSRKGDGDP
jgi:hypothetical protein